MHPNVYMPFMSLHSYVEDRTLSITKLLVRTQIHLILRCAMQLFCTNFNSFLAKIFPTLATLTTFMHITSDCRHTAFLESEKLSKVNLKPCSQRSINLHM